MQRAGDNEAHTRGWAQPRRAGASVGSEKCCRKGGRMLARDYKADLEFDDKREILD